MADAAVAVTRQARQLAGRDLPEETLPCALGRRYGGTDRLLEIAWNLFGQAGTCVPGGIDGRA